MPTYEYACRECGEHLEVVQSFKDDPLTECPACDGELRKVFSAAGIIFKGSGWHIKDYGTSKSAATTGSDSSTPDSDSSSKTESSSETKSTSKTASKSESSSSESKSA